MGVNDNGIASSHVQQMDRPDLHNKCLGLHNLCKSNIYGWSFEQAVVDL